MKVYFPRLTKLKPTLVSSVIKLTEEIGELSREITKYPYALKGILTELMDVGQVCATMMFLVEDENATTAINSHVLKLYNKGYLRKMETPAGIVDKDGDKVLYLPRLDIAPTVQETFLKLTEEAGELAHHVGKENGMSGEKNAETTKALMGDLLDVAQTCVTMLYILVDENYIDVERLLSEHKKKLKEHGYL